MIFLCRLVGDNIDINIQAKIQSETQTNRSIHWTQQYAIRNRINEPSFDTKSPQIPLKDIDLINLLPNKKVQENLKMRWAILVGRVICKYLTKFKHLNRVVVYHINHAYSKEMASKSDIVSEYLTFFLNLTTSLINMKCQIC